MQKPKIKYQNENLKSKKKRKKSAKTQTKFASVLILRDLVFAWSFCILIFQI